jgi:hypothetical protein
MRHTPEAIAQSWDDADLTASVVRRILTPMPGGGLYPDTLGFLALVRAALTAHAPHNLHLVPDGIPMQGEVIPPAPPAGLFEEL